MKGFPGVFTPTTVIRCFLRTADSSSVMPRIGFGGYILASTKSSSNSMKSSIRPDTRCATRSPASASG